MGLPTFMREPALTGLIRISPINRIYLFPQLFPFRDTAADEFMTWVELDQNPLAPFVSVDGVTPKMGGDLYSRMAAAVAYIRYKRAFKQSDLRIFEEIAASQHSEIARMQFDKRAQILKSVNKLNASIDARLEWLAINALRGSISVDDEGIQFTVTYPGPFTGDNARTASTYWDQDAADPVEDLMLWIEEVGDSCGTDPTRLVVSRRILRVLGGNAAIRDLWVTGQYGVTGGTLPPRFVIDTLKIAGIQQVFVYDAKWTDLTFDSSTAAPTRTTNRYLPNNLAFLLPSGPVGNMVTAPGPDGIRTGKFAWTKEEVDPWIVEVGTGIYAFPEIVDLNTWAYCTVLESAT